jgi:hypothetical protein
MPLPLISSSRHKLDRSRSAFLAEPSCDPARQANEATQGASITATIAPKGKEYDCMSPANRLLCALQSDPARGPRRLATRLSSALAFSLSTHTRPPTVLPGSIRAAMAIPVCTRWENLAKRGHSAVLDSRPAASQETRKASGPGHRECSCSTRSTHRDIQAVPRTASTVPYGRFTLGDAHSLIRRPLPSLSPHHRR